MDVTAQHKTAPAFQASKRDGAAHGRWEVLHQKDGGKGWGAVEDGFPGSPVLKRAIEASIVAIWRSRQSFLELLKADAL